MIKLCVLAVGDPFDGMALYGPFDDTEGASLVGESSYHGSDWWVVDLTAIEGAALMPVPLHPEAQECYDTDPWCEHAQYGRGDWRDEVNAGETSLGYFEWLSHKLEQESEKPEG